MRRRWYDLVLAAQDDIATIMTVESGKPLAESKSEFLGGCAACTDEVQPRECVVMRADPDPDLDSDPGPGQSSTAP